MTNVTLAVDADVLRRARLRAISEDTSVNAQVRAFLDGYAGGRLNERQRAVRTLIDLSSASRAGSGSEGRTWTRGDLYDD